MQQELYKVLNSNNSWLLNISSSSNEMIGHQIQYVENILGPHAGFISEFAIDEYGKRVVSEKLRSFSKQALLQIFFNQLLNKFVIKYLLLHSHKY